MARVLRPAIAAVALLLSLIALPAAQARAATFVVNDRASCEALGGDYSPGVCRFDGLNPLDVAAGDRVQAELNINTAYLFNHGTIALGANTASALGGVVGDNNGTITVASGATLTLNGDFSNTGTITVAGGATLRTVLSGSRDVISNTGTIIVACGGTVDTSSGTITGNQPVFLGCTPTGKEQCTNGGYARFTDPATKQPFTNQGRCTQFVNTGK